MEGCSINPYSTLSRIYDISRENENISEWIQFIEDVLKNCNISAGSKVLDCGCGTGDISIFLAKSGYVVDAMDVSSDMLIIAKEKSHNLGLNINYTIQDMRKFKSNSKYSMISCINDGINYLTSLDDVELFFKNCSSHLNDNGLLLFDISTIYKLKNMDGELYAEDDEEFSYFWFNEYDSNTNLLTMELTFFTQYEKDLYQRSSERHIQRGHSLDEIKSLLKECGYTLMDLYSDISFDKPHGTSKRVHFLAKKI